MYGKVKKISVILGVLMLALSSCHQSYFQILTKNDIEYWRTEECITFHGYSKKDSTFEFYDENMKQKHYQWVWLEMCEHKFRISNDTLYRYMRDKKTGKCYPEFTFQIISSTRNKLIVNYILSEDDIRNSIPSKPYIITWYRVKARDVKRIKKGKKVTFKDCKDKE